VGRGQKKAHLNGARIWQRQHISYLFSGHAVKVVSIVLRIPDSDRLELSLTLFTGDKKPVSTDLVIRIPTGSLVKASK
jgi:hypothetical protein